MKKSILIALALPILMSCQDSLGPTLPLNQPAGFQAQSANEQDLTVRILRGLYKENLADDVDNGKAVEPVSLPRGGFIFEGLSRIRLIRQTLYPISDRIIKHEFNKPSKPDNIPPIDASNLQQMQALLQPGDIVLCGNNDSFVHGFLYLGQDQIIHALAQLTPKKEFLGVIKETLTNYTRRTHRDKFVVLRKPGITPQDVQNMSDYAHKQVGKSYDSLFLLDTEDRFYCTEVVWQAMQKMAAPPRVYPHRAKYGWDMVTVEDIMDSPDLKTVWTYNYTRPPVGKLHTYR